jgi:hypothetical protein
MLRARLAAIGVLIVLAVPGAAARAQFFGRGGGIGPGSTVQGDILRGEGIFLNGAGLYNYYTANANAINTQTWMTLNEYIFQSVRAASQRYAARRSAEIASNREHYKKYLDQLLNDPEFADVERGSALNILFDKLTNPQVESALRLAPVHLSNEDIRSIPFFYAPRDATISLERLTTRGKWPVGLRGPDMLTERRAYDRAVDEALEQQLEGKLSREAIAAVDTAVTNLYIALDRSHTPSRDTIYLEAKNYLKRLETMKDLFKLQVVEQILAEIDKYSGTTVYDLIKFMERNNLRFGVADEIGHERDLFPRLYAALRQQLDQVEPGAITPKK